MFLSYLKENYKKFVLVLLLVPAVILVDKMEFPKVDAFIRDALQYLNSGDEVDKRIVTVNIDTLAAKCKPFSINYIAEIIEKIEKQNPPPHRPASGKQTNSTPT